MLNDVFTVQRRAEVVGDNGVAVLSITNTYPGVTGVVTPASRNDLERLADDQRMNTMITITSHFAMRGAVSGEGIPDWVVWNGDTYQVTDVQSYQRYGLGFTVSVCGLIAAQPNVP